jgi:hypothetical protein
LRCATCDAHGGEFRGVAGFDVRKEGGVVTVVTTALTGQHTRVTVYTNNCIR